MELFAIVNHVIVCLKMNYPSISCTVGIQHRRYNPSSDCDRSSCRAAIRIYEDSLFKRTEQVVSLSDKKSFVRQEPTCPPRGAGESAPKSRILEEKKVQTKNLMCMEKTTGTRTGRKPKSDLADRKYSFRLNAEENTRFEKLLADSGAGNLTLFIKKSIFSGQIKVVKIDKATMDYYIRLTEFHKQFQAVGNNYNQVVRALKNNFGEKRARALLYKLERLSLELMLVCKKVMALTQEYERKWLQK